MGGGHHQQKIEIPDHTEFQIENAPELQKLQSRLAEKGLKDPWIRNEIWRYDRRYVRTPLQNMRTLYSRGLKTGLVLFGLTIAYEQLFMKKDEHHH